MHTLLLVTLTLSQGATSEDARCRANDLLSRDDSFCGEGGRFGSPLCDWFVIGGRWSGHLQEALLGQPYQAALKQELAEFGGRLPCQPGETTMNRLDELWHRFGGTGNHPYMRKRREESGSEDDAMPLDRGLYDHFLKVHEGMATNLPGCGAPCDFVDLDDELLDESFIGRKWLVVVDYHY